MFYLGDTLMTKKMTKGALFLEKLNGDEILQGSFKKDPRAVLKKFGFNVDDLPGEVATLFAGAGFGIIPPAEGIREWRDGME